ncbi:hypothetical protein UY3_14186 [Chelonia mydas]|uniref:Uncharacterized protein n=1 Tax=Chelonia mydas TaxID=8469 RepID=M7ATK4_CHEMY|nr:hypothetical protein UY3_14186 [Chelonia mydas]
MRGSPMYGTQTRERNALVLDMGTLNNQPGTANECGKRRVCGTAMFPDPESGGWTSPPQLSPNSIVIGTIQMKILINTMG